MVAARSGVGLVARRWTEVLVWLPGRRLGHVRRACSKASASAALKSRPTTIVR